MLHIGESEGAKCRGWYENLEMAADTQSLQVKQPPQPQQQQQPLSSSNSSLSSSSSSSLTQTQSLDTKSNDHMPVYTRQVTVEELFEGKTLFLWIYLFMNFHKFGQFILLTCLI